MSLNLGQKLKKILTAFLICGAFLFVVSPNNALAARAISNYQKSPNGTLTANEWNSLMFDTVNDSELLFPGRGDFVNTWATTTMAGPLGIGTINPLSTLDIPAGSFYVQSAAIGGLGITGQNSVVMADQEGNLSATSSTSFFSGNNILSLWGGAKNGNIWNGDAGVGNVGIGTTNPTALLTLQSTAALESATLSAEILDASNWTSTGWTGDYSAGFVHTVGSVADLSHPLTSAVGDLVQVSWTVTGRTAGSFIVTVGGESKPSNAATGSFGPKVVTANGPLIFTPTSDFNGTISVISAKKITGVFGASMILLNTAGLPTFELRSSTSYRNTFIGYLSGRYNTTGTGNLSQGYSALSWNTTGYANVAMGDTALALNTAGYYNLAQGASALYYNTTGYDNVAQGVSALQKNTTGHDNVAQGTFALYNNTTGNLNTALGTRAGYFQSNGTSVLQTASSSIYIGYNTMGYNNNDNNTIVIGSAAKGIGANSVVLGNDNILVTALKGKVGIGTTTPLSTLDIPAGDLYVQNAAIGSLGIPAQNSVVMADPEGNLSATSSTSFFVSNNILSLWSGTKNGNIYNGDAGAGNVGIGTTSPGVKLDIESASLPTIRLFQTGGTNKWTWTAASGASYLSDASNGIKSIYLTAGGGAQIRSNGDLVAFSVENLAPANSMIIKSTTGYVGIGISPLAKLHIDTTGLTSTDDAFRMGGSGQFKIDAPGVQGGRVMILSNGNVGIGTTTPDVKFNVYNSSAIETAKFETGGTFSYIRTKSTSGDNILGVESAGGWVGPSTNFPLNFKTNDAIRMTILNTSGKVGIGTTGPLSTLDIPATDSSFYVQSAAIGSLGIPAQNSVVMADPEGNLSATSSTSFFVSNNILSLWSGTKNGNIYNGDAGLGNVGIGTTTPSQKLDVAGALKLANATLASSNDTAGTSYLCDSTKTGTFRYDAVSGQSYLCDGIRWLNQKNCGIMTDDAGQTYGTVQIGGQCWMAENINIGTMLATGATEPTTTDNIIQKWCNGNSTNNCTLYGGLYNWSEAMRGSTVAGARGICASGWHIPTDAEYNKLEKTVQGIIASPNAQYPCDFSVAGLRRCADNNGADSGGTYGAGKSLKAVAAGSGNGDGNDLVGFAGKLSGFRHSNSSYSALGTYLYLWSSTLSGASNAWARSLDPSYSTVYRRYDARAHGFSVRCVKNSEENQTVNLDSYGGTYTNNFTINKDDASPNLSGSTLFTVLQGGNVGIGTSTPGELLQIGSAVENATNRKTLLFGVGGYAAPGNFSTASNGDKIIFYNGADFDGRFGGSAGAEIWMKIISTTNNSTAGSFSIYTSNGAQSSPTVPKLRANFGPGGSVALGGTITSYADYTGATMVLSGGKVGIGTTGPLSTLDIPATDSSFYVQSAAIGSLGIPAQNSVVMADPEGNLSATSSTSFFVSNNILSLWSGTKNGNIYNGDAGAGNVGIGTTGPGEKLSVYGNIVLRTDSTVNSWLKFGNVATAINTEGIGIKYGDGMYFDVYSAGAGGSLGTDSRDAMVIKQSGNVGIGTTTPIYPLHIYGSSKDVINYIQETGAGNYRAGLMAATDDSSVVLLAHTSGYSSVPAYAGKSVLQTSSGNFALVTATAGKDLEFYAGQRITPNMVIKDGGNVGIGTTTPGAKLEVFSSVSPNIYITTSDISKRPALWLNDGTNYAGMGFVLGDLRFSTTGSFDTPAMVIASSTGNVGIGTTNPLSTLDIPNSADDLYAYNAAIGSLGIPSQNSVVMADPEGNLSATSSTSFFVSNNILSLWSGTKNGNIYNGDAGAGNVGIGTTNPLAKLEVNGDVFIGDRTVATLGVYHPFSVIGTNTNTSGNNYGVIGSMKSTPASASSASYLGVYGNVDITGSTNLNHTGTSYGVQGYATYYNTGTSVLSNNRGVYGAAANRGDGTITNNYGISGIAYNISTGLITTNIGAYGASVNISSGTVTNAYGGVFTGGNSSTGLITKFIGTLIGSATNPLTNAGTITDTYGLYIGDLSNGTQTNYPYSLYASDPNTYNYLAGKVGIGTTAPAYTTEISGTFKVSTSSSSIMLDASGNVLIGI